MEKDSNKINEQDFIAATTFVGKDEIQNCNSCNEGQPCDWIMMKDDMRQLGCEFFNEFMTVSDIKDEKKNMNKARRVQGTSFISTTMQNMGVIIVKVRNYQVALRYKSKQCSLEKDMLVTFQQKIVKE